MPSGFTEGVSSGEVTSFKQFALKVARGFGACIMQRDESFNNPIKMDEPSDWHKKELESAKEELRYFEDDPRGSYQEYLIDDKKFKVSAFVEVERQNELRKRYESMLEKVRGYNPPTEDHVDFKNYMINQLQESIKHDCDNTYWKERLTSEPVPYEEWLSMTKDHLEASIAYHQEGWEAELKGVHERNVWKLQLIESLDEYEKLNTI